MAVSTARKPHQRYHLANGDRVPGVTTILDVINKPALPVWANRLGFNRVNATDHLDFLASAGTLAHHMIEHRLIGGALDIAGYTQDQTALAERALSGFLAWAEGKALETHELELSLISETHGYGGTLDFLGLVDGVLTVADWKTSGRIYDDHLYQLAGYHGLLTENGYTVDGAMVLRLDRDDAGEWSERVLSVPEIAPYFNVFLAALSLHNFIKLATKRRARRW